MRVRRSTTPLSVHLAKVWRAPFRLNALPTLVFMALWVTVFEGLTAILLEGTGLFASLWAFIPASAVNVVYAIGLICAWLMAIVRRTASGDESLDAPSFTDLGSSLLRPAWLAVVGLSWVWLPAVSRLLATRSIFDDPVIALLIVFACVYAPAVLLVAASGGGTLQVANPWRIVATVWALGWPYLSLVPLVALAAIPALVLHLASFRSWSVVPLLAPWALQVASLIPLVIMARALGVLLRVHGDRVEYGPDSDYLDPVLPGAEPRGTLPS